MNDQRLHAYDSIMTTLLWVIINYWQFYSISSLFSKFFEEWNLTLKNEKIEPVSEKVSSEW